jgi:hypothetical protein
VNEDCGRKRWKVEEPGEQKGGPHLGREIWQCIDVGIAERDVGAGRSGRKLATDREYAGRLNIHAVIATGYCTLYQVGYGSERWGNELPRLILHNVAADKAATHPSDIALPPEGSDLSRVRLQLNRPVRIDLRPGTPRRMHRERS